MYVGITDYDWFSTLQQVHCDEVNFWKPGGKTTFKALDEGDLFLFKLHSPQDFIVGGGFFLKFSIVPVSLAWDAFGVANGARDIVELNERVRKYKKTDRLSDPDPQIGCVILTMPFFFEQSMWIPVPRNWQRSIVQGKMYDSFDDYGSKLYRDVQDALNNAGIKACHVEEFATHRYGAEQVIRPRIGQGAFKVFITDAYRRRCAITGEKTLPVLEAAHIRPYSLEGPHEIRNGLLLRRDFHTLLDRGYITVDKNLTVLVSHRIKEDFSNGKEYYSHHGQKLITLPERMDHLPDSRFLEWHNNNVYLG